MNDREPERDEGETAGREPEKGQVSWLQMAGSAVAAAFGVQSRRNRERDFQQGDIRKFVVVGVVGTLLFLLGLMGVVKLVLSNLA